MVGKDWILCLQHGGLTLKPQWGQNTDENKCITTEAAFRDAVSSMMARIVQDEKLLLESSQQLQDLEPKKMLTQHHRCASTKVVCFARDDILYHYFPRFVERDEIGKDLTNVRAS